MVLSRASLHHGRLGGWLARITLENKGVNDYIKALEMSSCFAFRVANTDAPQAFKETDTRYLYPPFFQPRHSKDRKVLVTR